MSSIRYTLAFATIALLLPGCKDASGPRTGPPASLLAQSPLEFLGAFGQPLATPPRVAVFDAAGRPVAGVAVMFSVAGAMGAPVITSQMTLADGTATLSALTVPNTFGITTVIATVEALPPITFRLTAIAPDAGVVAFDLAEPVGDTLAEAKAGDPKGIDVVRIRGDFKRDTLLFTLTFAAPVVAGAANAPNSVTGLIDLDLDDNAATGPEPFSNEFGAKGTIGVERVLFLGGPDPSSALITDGTSQMRIATTYVGNSVTMRIPMSLLGNDDGNFTFVGVMGTIDRPTDVFPNAGQIAVRRGTVVAGIRGSQVRPMPADSYSGNSGWRSRLWSSGRTGREP